MSKKKEIETTKQYYKDYLKELVGGKIVEVTVDIDSEDPFGEPYLGFVVKKGTKSFQVFALRDPEGNGPGHMEIINIADQGEK